MKDKTISVKSEIRFLKQLRKTMYETGVAYSHCRKIDKRIKFLTK